MYQHVLEIAAHMEETEFQEFTIGEKIVVTQYEEIREAAQQAGLGCRINKEPELGISHSIRLGVEAVEELSKGGTQDAILFVVSVSYTHLRVILKTDRRREPVQWQS